MNNEQSPKEEELQQNELQLNSLRANDVQAGSVLLKRFRIESRIAQGAQACLYKTEDILLGREAALKVLTSVSDDAAAKRFTQEAQLLASLEHPNIVRTYSFGVSDSGLACLAMEYVEGLSLAHYLEAHKKLSNDSFFSVFSQLLDALQYLHENSIIHRDIKPANVLCVIENGKITTVKLADFGIAKLLQDPAAGLSATQTRSMGTASYLSPEQCLGKVIDARSDLYALACVMFEAVMGTRPFDGNTDYESMYNHINAAPPPMVNLSEPIRNLIAKGLEKDPAKRFQSAKQMQAALKGCQTMQNPEMAFTDSAMQSRSSKKPAWAAPLALVVFALLLGGSFILSGRIKNKKAVDFVGSAIPTRKIKSPELLVDKLSYTKGSGPQAEFAKYIIANYPEPKFYRARRDAYRILAPQAYSLGDYDEAIRIRHQWLADARKSAPLDVRDFEIVDALTALVQDERSVGRGQNNRANLEEVRSILQRSPAGTARTRKLAEVYVQYAYIAQSELNFAEEEKNFREALRLTEESAFRSDRARELKFNLSLVLLKQHRFEEAEKLVDEELGKERSPYLQEHYPGWLGAWSLQFLSLGRYKRALELLKLAEAPAGAREPREGALADIYAGEGRVYAAAGDQKKANEYFLKALMLFRQSQSSVVSNRLIELGNCFFVGKRADLAKESWKVACQKIEIGDTKLNANLLPYLNLAQNSLRLGYFKEASDFCQDARVFVHRSRSDDPALLKSISAVESLIARREKAANQQLKSAE